MKLKEINKEQKQLKKLLDANYRKKEIKRCAKELQDAKTFKEMEDLISTLDMLIDLKTIKSLIRGLQDVKEGKYVSEEEFFEKMEKGNGNE